MKDTNTNVTRRGFLTKGAGIAAVSSIIAIEASAETKEVNSSIQPMLANEVVYTEQVQTLTNKTISAANNNLIIGTDYLNVMEFPIDMNTRNITTALNSAITALSQTGSRGGQILIPQGLWTSNGGHDFAQSISIEGVGFGYDEPINAYGTEIKLISGTPGYMFRIKAKRNNCSLKNLAINLTNYSNAIGLLMDNPDDGSNDNTKYTSVENVGFMGGAYGIKVFSIGSLGFECILNRFERVNFSNCQTAFYCNSANGGYSFDNCFFQLPPYIPAQGNQPEKPGIAFDCEYMGNLSVNHCLFIGTTNPGAWRPPIDKTTILRTTGSFNNITFYDCQDENVEFYYQSATTINHIPWAAITFRNCLIQSKFKFNAYGSVVFDSCQIALLPKNNLPPSQNAPTEFFPIVSDSATGAVKIYLKGLCNFYSYLVYYGIENSFADLQNPYSEIYKSLKPGIPYLAPTAQQVYTTDRLSGIVTCPINTGIIYVNNFNVKPNSIVFTQQRGGGGWNGARISHVTCNTNQFVITMTAEATIAIDISYLIVN